MKASSGLSTHADPARALDEVADALPSDIDLLVAFATPHHAPSRSGLARRLSERFPGALIIGCTGGGVLASGREAESSPGLAVLAATLPGVDLKAFHFDRALMGPPNEAANAVVDSIQADSKGLMLLSDPYTFDMGPFVPAVAAALPGLPLFGGQASGIENPGPHELFLRDRVLPGGTVGLSFSGAIRIETCVAQGCRPVGPPMFVTACVDNHILELDGVDPVEKLKDVYEELPSADRALFREGQLLGVQMRDQDEYAQGDFLIRHVLGVPKGSRGLAIGGTVEKYAVVQLQVRDRESAHDDLVNRLHNVAPPDAALLFSCLGRGRGLYGQADHDSQAFFETVAPTPLAGFFANGELGPVHGTPHMHGYTSVFALFYDE